jgi:origin recognition complex subunit 4
MPSPAVQSLLKKIFYSTKSVPDVLAALYIPIATLHVPADPKSSEAAPQQRHSSIYTSQPSLLGLLKHLPTLHLSLLVAATRLETIHNLTTVNFALVYTHYTELLARSKLQRSSALLTGGALTGTGMRSWSKETARGVWEDLASWELIVPVSGLAGNSVGGRAGEEGIGGESAGTRMYRLDVTLDEVAWAVKEKLGNVGAGDVLGKWCREV